MVKDVKAVTPKIMVRCFILVIVLWMIRPTYATAEASIVTSILNSDSEEAYYTLTVQENRLYIEGMTEEDDTEFYYAFYTPENNEYVTVARTGSISNHSFHQELLLPTKNGDLLEGFFQLFLNLSDSKCSPCIVINDNRVGLYLPKHYARNTLADTFLHKLNKNKLIITNLQHKYDSSRSDLTLTKDQRNELFAFARQLTEGLSSDYDQVKAIYRWITDHIYYDNDAFADSNANNNPYWVYQNRRGVCEGYTRLMVELLTLLCIPSAAVIGDAGSVPVADLSGSNHSWVAVYADDRWFYADPTWDSGNQYTEGVFSEDVSTSFYFDLTLEGMTASHCTEYIEGAIETEDFDVTFYDGEVSVDTYNGSESMIALPKKAAGLRITQVTGYFADAFNDEVKGIVVPKGYRTLYNSAFQRYLSLEYVVLPDTMVDIQDNVFYNCEDTVTLCNDHNPMIEDYAMENEIAMLRQEPNLIYGKDKLTISEAVIADIPKQTYTGTALSPEPAVTYQGRLLRRNIDYALIYKDNHKAGLGTVSILGMGNYYGVKSKAFSILPRRVSLRINKKTKNSVKAYWKESPGATGYEIQYSLTEEGSYQSIGYHLSLECIIESLEPGYTYYFKIRPYVYIGLKVYYGDFSKAVSIKM